MSASVVEAKPVLKWRVVDIAVASVIGVASALIYWAVAFFSAAPWSVLEAVVPGLAGIFNGLWLFAGPLAAVIVRKPGLRSMRKSWPACLRRSWATCGVGSKRS